MLTRLKWPIIGGMRTWWRELNPTQQDRMAMLAPLASVLIFFLAIVAALTYLRVEEINREQEAIERDVEYAQQTLRQRLAALGTSCPDHFLRTKIAPLTLDPARLHDDA